MIPLGHLGRLLVRLAPYFPLLLAAALCAVLGLLHFFFGFEITIQE